MLQRGGHEVGADDGAAVGQGFLVADGLHAQVEVGGGGEFEGLGREGLEVAFADFELPVWKREAQKLVDVAGELGQRRVWGVIYWF